MRLKFALLSAFVVISTSLFSQNWFGSTGTAGMIFRDGEITTVKGTGPSRVPMGFLWGDGGLDWSHGYLSFNSSRTGTGSNPWVFDGNGAGNGSAALLSNIAGHIFFSTKPSSGGSGGTLTDEQVMGGIKMRIENDGRVVIGNAPSWGFNGLTWPGNYRLYVQ